ncbi:MAG: hypothetical protein KA885_01460 [Spirochaetes bacterium]|nr:hypothetical protein [Spirochaetota bacterium]
MAKKSFINKIDNADILESIENINMDIETKREIKKFVENPEKEKYKELEGIIISDSRISPDQREELIETIKTVFVKTFNFDNCPEDYEELKREAKFLAGITQYSFLLMAQRLIKIRDNELYKIDGYPDFISFIKSELSIAKRTTYHYINIIECFGAPALALEENIQYSKLLPFIPILKSNNEDIPKQKLKEKAFQEIKTKSYREIENEAREIKIKYGILKEGEKMSEFEKLLFKVRKKIPDTINENEEFQIRKLFYDLKEKITLI